MDIPTRPTRATFTELLTLAWPLILSQSFWTTQIVLDRILLSNKGVEDVGAGISAVMLFWTGLALFQYTTNYATTFVAQYTGAGQPLRAGASVGQSLWFALVAGLLFIPLALVAEPIVSLTGHDAGTQAKEAAYLRCLFYAALPILLTAACTSFFAGRGESRTVLWLNVVGLVVNGPLAYAMIFGQFGFPEMGIEGAGWATVAGTWASALVGLAAMLQPQFREEFGNGWGWAFDGELFGRLMYYGVPQGIGTAVEVGAFSLFLVLIGRMGTEDLAASSIACTLNLLAFLPMMGVGQAVEVLVGQRIGESAPDRAEQATWAGLVVAVSFTAGVALLYALVPHWLAWPFQTHNDPEGWAAVSARVPLLLRFVAAYCLFDSVMLVFAYALRGAGDTQFVTLATCVLSWPVMVLPGWLAWQYDLGMYVAWLFASLYVVLLSLTLYVRFRLGAWRRMKVIEESPAEELAPAET